MGTGLTPVTISCSVFWDVKLSKRHVRFDESVLLKNVKKPAQNTPFINSLS